MLASETPLNLLMCSNPSLSDELVLLHRSTVESGNVFIKDFLLNRLTSATLPELCSLYPGHERIQSVAVALIQNQVHSDRP